MAAFHPSRAVGLLALLGATLFALLGRVAYLQTRAGDLAIEQAERQQHRNDILHARRGSIFDRNGLLMAGTVQTDAVFVDPQFLRAAYLEDPRRGEEALRRDLAELARWIDQPADGLRRLIEERRDERFVVLLRQADPATVERVRALRVPGVGALPVNQRYYPMGSLAAHVLGAVGAEGKGLEGVELRYNDVLAGRDGYKRSLRSARRQSIGVSDEDYLPPQHGQHLVLSLDSNLQLFAEEELRRACREFNAPRGEAILLDPDSGEVLALAVWPAYHPQNLEDSTGDLRRNRAVSDMYEPGSVMKPFIVASALNRGAVRVGEVLPINGPTRQTGYGRVIEDVHPYPALTIWDVLVKSSNIGMTAIGQRMGNAALHEALASFGFGRPTGIDLPGEAMGLLNPLRRWSRYSPDSLCQGYELLVTPIQLARAEAALVNGGRLVTPRVVRGVFDGDAVAPPAGLADQALHPQPISAAMSVQMVRILADTPVRGTAQKARMRHWNLFGKTGTAHVTKGGAYDEEHYTATFVGGAPAENPRLVVVLAVHEPDRSISHFAGIVAAPAASRVLQRALAYLEAPPSPALPLPPPEIAASLYGFDPRAYTRVPRDDQLTAIDAASAQD